LSIKNAPAYRQSNKKYRLAPLDSKHLTGLARIFFCLAIISMVVFNLAPFLWQFFSSLKNSKELYLVPVTYIPAKVSLTAYEKVISNPLFLRYFLNSVIVSIFTTFVTLSLASFAGYALSRLKLKFKTALQFLLLLACLFPQIIFLVPLYELMARFSLISKPLALVLPYVTFSLPLAIWMMTRFFLTIPKEIEEQAMVDGFKRLAILRKIILPLSWPALATTAILIFIGPFAWNEFLFSLSFMIKDTSKTVPVGIALLSGTSMYEIPWSQICAACVLTTLPLVLFVIIFERKIIEGLTRGAVKG